MISDSLGGYIKKSQKGKQNGVCELDENGLVPLTRLNPNVLEFKGDWDALINSPLLQNGALPAFTGNVYIVSVAGTQWTIDFEIGDLVVYDGLVWKRIPVSSTNTYLQIANNLSDLNNVVTARTNLDVYSKTEVDTVDTTLQNQITTLQNTKVSTISNTDTKLTIDNTNPTNPIINVLNNFRWGNGAYRGLLYENQTPVSNTSQIAFNSASISSISTVNIGFYGLNGGSDSDIASSTKGMWKYVIDNLPFTIRIIDSTNIDSYFTLKLNSYAGVTGSAYFFNCSYVSAQTTMTNLPANGTKLYLLLDTTNKNYIDAQDTSLQSQITTNASNVTALQTNKIDTLTSGNNFLTITGTGVSRTLTVRSNSYLSGAVTITNTGLLQLDGVSQTGHPYVTNGSTMTVNDDLIISGSFTMASGSNLVVEGNLIVLGTVSLYATTTITATGIIQFRGLSSANTFTCIGCSITTSDEFSVRNFTSSIYIFWSGTNAIKARSIVFENNTTSCYFSTSGSAHTLTADDILFRNNSNQPSGTGSNATVYMANMTINSNTMKFLNNSSNVFVAEFRPTVTITTNIFDGVSNTSTGALGGYTFYFGTVTINSDIFKLKDNSHNTDTACFFTATSIINSKHVFLINNLGVFGDTGSVMKSDFVNISVSGATQNITWSGSIYGLYSTTRMPQYTIQNSSATITGFNKESYLGVVPMCWKQFLNYVTPYSATITSTGGTLKLSPTSYTFGPTLGAGYNQFQNLYTQFSATANNSQLQYVGRDNAFIQIEVVMSVSIASHRTTVFEIYKNGSTYVQTSSQYIDLKSTNGYVSANINCMTTAVPNDYFEISAFVPGGASTTINFASINFIIKKLSVL